MLVKYLVADGVADEVHLREFEYEGTLSPLKAAYEHELVRSVVERPKQAFQSEVSGAGYICADQDETGHWFAVIIFPAQYPPSVADAIAYTVAHTLLSYWRKTSVEETA